MLQRYIAVMIQLVAIVNGTKSLNDTKTLLKDLMRDYDRNVRPVKNQDMTLNISVRPYIKAIQEFDEVHEVFAYTGAFEIDWHDAGMVWNPDDYGGVDEVEISYKNVWVPDLVLTTPSDEMESFGRSWQVVTFSSTGSANWLTGGLMRSICSVDVRKYPFDKQVCISEFTVWGYDLRKVELFPENDKVDLSLFLPNIAWTLEDSSVKATLISTWSELEVTFYLRRKAAFVIINILMPILFLNLINCLVFVLIPESGERISFCITVLLSIAVFMTIISDTLPSSSEPLPVISYKLMLDMIISSLITLVTIFNLGLYYKDEKLPVPNWLKTLYSILYGQRSKSQKFKRFLHGTPKPDGNNLCLSNAANLDVIKADIAIENEKKVQKPTKSEPFDSCFWKCKSENEIDASQVSWRAVSRMIDCISLAVFTIMTVLSFGVFMLYTNIN